MSEPVGNDNDMMGPLPGAQDGTRSDFGRQSNFSFASSVFTNGLKGRVKSIKEKQTEYALCNVPKPKQRKQWKQDLSHLKQLPGTHILPAAPSKADDPKKKQSPEKTRMKEF